MVKILVLMVTCFFVLGCVQKTKVIKTQTAETKQSSLNHGPKVSSDNRLEQGKKLFYAAKYKQASKNFIRSITRNKDNWEAYYYLGLTQQKQGRYDRAIGSFNNSLKYSPIEKETRSKINYSLAVSWENEGYYGRAGDLYVKALRLNPKHAGARAGKERAKIKAQKIKKKRRYPKAR